MSRVDLPPDSLSAEKRALFALLLSREGLRGQRVDGIARRTEPGPVPLSFAQQRLWLAEQITPGSAAYNVAAVLRLDGALHAEALEHAFVELLRRHEVLRTRFITENGEPMQVIDPVDAFPITRVDLTHLDPSDHEAALGRLSRDEARRPFALTQAPLLRATLVQLDRSHHVLLLTMHHIASDGWSVGILMRELSALYTQAVCGRPATLPELPVQYADYAVWQRRRADAGAFDRGLSYWKDRLSGASGQLLLPTDRPRAASRTFEGALHRISFPADLTDAVKAFSRKEGVTLYMTLVAGFMVLLHRWSGQDDILVGSPLADRSRPELEPLIGFFTNTVALRVNLAGDPDFHEVVARVQPSCLGAFEHQDVPYSHVVEAVQPERVPGFAPLVQVLFVLQTAPKPVVELQGLALRIDDGETGASPFDLTLSLQEAGGCLVGSFEYSTELFDAETIVSLTAQLGTLLREATMQPDRPVSHLSLMSEDERQRVLSWGQGERRAIDAGRVQDLVTRQSRRTPDAFALHHGAGAGAHARDSLTYEELTNRAGRVAQALVEAGVGPEIRVGLCVQRSGAWAVALLGILEAGPACVLLDPAAPPSRIRHLADIARAELVVVDRETAPTFVDRRVLDVDAAGSSVAAPFVISPQVGASNLAFVIFTSGSTGDPKCVGIPHSAVVNHCSAVAAAWELTGADRVLQFSALGFDVALEELLPAWSRGAAVLLRPWSDPPSIAEFVDYIDRERITVVNLPSSFWHAWADEVVAGSASVPAHVRLVICGSERTWMARLRGWQRTLNHRGRWLNAYGTTETAITTTFFDPARAEVDSRAGVVPVGHPIANTDLFVLDRDMQLVPPAVAGELYVGGEGLARGYLGDPAGTAQRFVPHPFTGRAGARLYRTGDRARWRKGQLEILGRTDRQVKVRGVRVEPGEIEAVLNRHPAVEQCAVVSQDAGAGDVRLIAHVVAKGCGSDSEPLRAYLAERLPPAMVPARVIAHAALPVTSAGKIDYRALALQAVEPARPAYEGPRSRIENAIADIWTDVLGTERVGIHDNFFALGGHSLLALQVVSRIRTALQVEVPLRHLFEHPTVADLAASVEWDGVAPDRDRPVTIVPVSRDVPVPLSVEQEQVWWMEQFVPNSPLFNMPFALRVRGALDVPAVFLSLDEIIRRHESLRTRYTRDHSGPVQTVVPAEPLERVIVDLTGLERAEQDGEVEQRARHAAFRAFDLTGAPLLRAGVLRLAADEYVVLMTVHHIAADGWSVDLLGRELGIFYQAVRAGVPSPSPEPAFQYRDYAHWQRAQFAGEEHRAALDYWTRQLASCPPQPLPTDRPRPAEPTFDTAVIPLAFGSQLTNDVQDLSRRLQCTSFMVLLAAFKVTLHRWTGADDLRVATLAANRQRTEWEALIGLFANTIVLRTDLSGDPTFCELAGRVRACVLDGYARQQVPLELVVRQLEADPGFDRGTVVNVEFQWEPEAASFAIPGLDTSPLRSGGRMSDLGITLTTSDLVVSLTAQSAGIVGTVTYKRALFDAETVKRLGIDFSDVVRQVVREPQRKLSEFLPKR